MSALADQVDAIFADWDRPDSPGCALAIIQDGEIVYRRGYGCADLEHDAPITPGTVFDIASTSKQFTATCLALLARQGKLSLDEQIRQFLPEMPAWAERITLRNLIHHTSGIRDYLTLMELAGMPFENEYPDEEIFDLICRQKALNFEPGEEHLYSDTGYLLLGEIVKRVSGKSLRAFAHEWIFGPLGMQKTHFHDDFTEIVKDRAVGYSVKNDGGFRTDMSIFDVVGDGCVYTTVEDLYLWDQNFYHNTIGDYGQDLISEITTPGKLNNGKLLDYAFGLALENYRGLEMIGHGGDWAGYRSEMIRFPEHKFSVICLANLGSIDPSRLARKVADIHLGQAFAEPADEIGDQAPAESANPASAAPETGSLSAGQLEQFAGDFICEELGAVYRLDLAEDGLRLERKGFPKEGLIATGPESFEGSGITLDFRRDDRGEIRSFQLGAGRVKNLLFLRLVDEPDAIPALDHSITNVTRVSFPGRTVITR